MWLYSLSQIQYIFYGFETGVTELLKNIDGHKKNRSFEKMKEVSRWTKDANIEIRGSFMIGLPGETPELARETIKRAIELDPEYAQFSITTPYPGTRLYKEIKDGKWGKFTTDDFSEFQGWNVVFLPNGYKDKGQVWEMEGHYSKTAVELAESGRITLPDFGLDTTYFFGP